ncbi:hypothetical protein HZY97_05195 [Sphingomonas sp. R-74633]|uniref:hypothetical protein n=1 Tax=Sphingomonas sp. R-74633 TaxID=2751188 RepID=UPI0015D1E889|nr:hypothetical protein [Sphingomonas sp. R-74633]NYT40141.1 hypothetical protein [Sphingomonas sp. R-74633]
MIALQIALLLAAQEVAAPALLSSEDRFVPIDDAALLKLVKTPFDPKSDRRQWRLAIGLHHGVQVVASYVCSDVCPAYTKRIIRYNLRAGPGCEAAGGVSKALTVPMGIGVGQRLYCLPAVTAPWQN